MGSLSGSPVLRRFMRSPFGSPKSSRKVSQVPLRDRLTGNLHKQKVEAEREEEFDFGDDASDNGSDLSNSPPKFNLSFSANDLGSVSYSEPTSINSSPISVRKYSEDGNPLVGSANVSYRG